MVALRNKLRSSKEERLGKVNWQQVRDLFGDKKVFSYKDFEALGKNVFGLKDESITVVLARAVKRGILWNLCKKWYGFANDLPSPDKVATTVVSPSYVSLERALSLSGILSQGTFVITIMTPLAWSCKKSFVIKYPDKYLKKYGRTEFPVEVHLTKRINPEYLNEIAPPEVALVDLLYVRGVVERKWNYLYDIFSDVYWDEIDLERFKKELHELRSLHDRDRVAAIVKFLKETAEKFKDDPRAKLPPEEQLERLFSDLSSSDPRKAFRRKSSVSKF